MIGLAFWAFAVVITVPQAASAVQSGRGEDSLHFSGRREPDNSEYARRRRPQNNEGGSYIENVFKIPLAVIRGTSAAAQAFSPQNTGTIEKIFDIPVMTLDAVGNFIKETRPQRPVPDDDYDYDEVTEQRPVRVKDEDRDQRRERITKMREDERQRRRLAEQERQRRRIQDQERHRRRMQEQQKFSHFGNHPALNFASGLSDLLLGGGGGGHKPGGFFGGHGHGHGHGLHGRPSHRPQRPQRPIKPSRPLKPHKPGHHGGQLGNQEGNNGYEVHEQIDDDTVQYSSGIFPWLQTTSESNRNKIQNKVAPGPEYRNSQDRSQLRFPGAN